MDCELKKETVKWTFTECIKNSRVVQKTNLLLIIFL